MLSSFDWLRRCRTGTELLATLKCIEEIPDLPEAMNVKPPIWTVSSEIGPPHSASNGPCQRCWIYARVSEDYYCDFCKMVYMKGRSSSFLSRRCVLIWGVVRPLPSILLNRDDENNYGIIAAYIHDENRFLVALKRRNIKSWMQTIVFHHGQELKGNLQVFPTSGYGQGTGMGDILCMAIRNASYLPRNEMYVRFYSSPFQTISNPARDRKGAFTFEISQFLALLEMAEIFRALLRPEEQKELKGVLTLKDSKEERFYWGRFLGRLEQDARDMLNAWGIRNWSRNRVDLLYELTSYVSLPEFG